MRKNAGSESGRARGGGSALERKGWMFRTKAGLEMGERGGGAIERGRPSAGRTLAGGRGLKRCQLRWRRGHDVAQEREWPTRGFPGERVKARASSKAPLYYLGCGQAGHNLVNVD